MCAFAAFFFVTHDSKMNIFGFVRLFVVQNETFEDTTLGYAKL